MYKSVSLLTVRLRLFQDKNFKDRVSTMFFSGELAQHKVETRSGFKKHPNRLLLDGVATLNALGEIITRKTTMLEELSGKILNDSLLQWASRLPRLKSLNLWDGGALVGAGSKLHEYCHSFNTLKFWSWGHEGADQKFAEFLREIVPQTLESLEVFSFSSIEAESFLALGGHGDSLTELKLHSLNSDAMHSLNKLKDCINLTTLLFTDGTNRNVNLKRGHPDIFQDIVAWLRQCKKLRSVTFRDLQGGQDLMTSILLEDSIHLTSLELKGYIMADSHEFHQALANQPTLQELLLHGETDEAGDGVATLVESLSQLANLTELRLQDISDYFTDEVISRLARSLPKLEGWWTSGWGVTDAVWRDIASLKSLRRLDLAATSRFTSNGILDFIFGLGPGNKGLVLAIMMADVDCNLSDEEQAMIRETIANQVDGRFEFQLQRGTTGFLFVPQSYGTLLTVALDPDISEYEGESD